MFVLPLYRCRNTGSVVCPRSQGWPFSKTVTWICDKSQVLLFLFTFYGFLVSFTIMLSAARDNFISSLSIWPLWHIWEQNLHSTNYSSSRFCNLHRDSFGKLSLHNFWPFGKYGIKRNDEIALRIAHKGQLSSSFVLWVAVSDLKFCYIVAIT